MQTILNRVESEEFPDTVYEVISQEGQFTTFKNGRYENSEPTEDSQEALELLDDMRNNGQLYFEKISENETWQSKNLDEVTKYRHHIFYK